MSIVQVNNLYFKYKKIDPFELKINEFTVNERSTVFIKGSSGCGKTTFLNLLTGLIQPIDGEINILNRNLSELTQVNCDRFRADHFGIIFQMFNLIPYLSVIENILLPCKFSKIKQKKVLNKSKSLAFEAERLCKELNIEQFLVQKPVNELSIGEQQRVAIARALIGQPEIIIADEPTSALDQDNRSQFVNLLLNECEKYNITLLFVSHDVNLQSKFNKSFNLSENGAH